MSNERRKIMGAKIVFYRKMKNYTQRQLAEKLGVSRQYLSNLEQGKISCNIEKVYELASALDISPEELVKENL